MKETLSQYLCPLVEEANGLVVMEAAHFYVKKGIDDQVLAGVSVAVDVFNLLAGFFGINSDRMLFIDDIGEVVEPFMIQAAITNLVNYGFEPDLIIYESVLVDKGKELIEGLKAGGLTKEHKGRTHLKQGWIPLQGKSGMIDYPSCEVLDTVLYQHKLDKWSGAITVLPHDYQYQQEKTKKVLKAVTGNETPNVVVIYHSQQAEITGMDYWGQNEK